MSDMTYNVVMFAYNEEQNITASIKSVFANADGQLERFFLLANGCSDDTVKVAKRVKQELGFDALNIVEITLGDKCNAWNMYMHDLAQPADVHFFCDADVEFSSDCFPQMAQHLMSTPEQTVVVAGMPLSGRNNDFYHSLIVERSCFFGNLYGMKHSFVQRIQDKPFRLPIGLNWIDSFLTKAVNTDLNFFDYNLPNRTTWIDNVGYQFEGLSIFRKSDFTLYVNRIARYELGKIQEIFLDELPCEQWPGNMHGINTKIDANFASLTQSLGIVKRHLVRKRLNKLLKNH